MKACARGARRPNLLALNAIARAQDPGLEKVPPSSRLSRTIVDVVVFVTQVERSCQSLPSAYEVVQALSRCFAR